MEAFTFPPNNLLPSSMWTDLGHWVGLGRLNQPFLVLLGVFVPGVPRHGENWCCAGGITRGELVKN